MNSEKLKKLFTKEAFFGSETEEAEVEVPEEEEAAVFSKDEMELDFIPTNVLSFRKDRLKKVAILPREIADAFNRHMRPEITSDQLRALARKTNIRRFFPDVQMDLVARADQIDAGQKDPNIRRWLDALATTLENYDLSAYPQSYQDAGPAAGADIRTLLGE